jgi:2-phospho-L-lactate guanylyltransferase (CobY/MobA/RfbA family)
MLGDVLAAARELGPVRVVTDDPAAVPRFAEHVPDPGEGLGGAVAAGLAGLAGHTLVVNADLPAVTPAVLRTFEAAGLSLVEALDGTTNALSLPDPRRFEPLYGPGSADRFRGSAPYTTTRSRELELDVDTLDDLERLGALLGPRTRALLAVPA